MPHVLLSLVAVLYAYGIGVRSASAGGSTSPVQIERSVIDRTRSGVGQVITEDSRGTGFFLRIRDRIVFLTSRHVVESALIHDSSNRASQVKEIRVRTPDGVVIRASVWKASRNHDVAILRLETVPSAILPLNLSSELPALGSEVFLWGAPYGEGLAPLDGMLMSIDQNANPRLFAGAPIRIINVHISVGPGNSGGPLLNRAGKVIGVVTARQESAENISTGHATAIAASVFMNAVLSLDPLDVNGRGGPPIDSTRRDEPEPGSRKPLTPSLRFSPPQERPTQTPHFARNDFELGKRQAQGTNCSQRLILPPSASVFSFNLAVAAPSFFLHFPKDYVRAWSIRFIGPTLIEVATRQSRDGGPTFICVVA